MSKAIRVRNGYRVGHRRLIATCEPHRVNKAIISWDDGAPDERNYIMAARALIDKIETRAGRPCGFHGNWTMGWLDNGDVVFVQEDGPGFTWEKKVKA